MQSILNIAISSNFKNCISLFCVQSSKCSKRAKFKSKAWTFYCFSLLLCRINWFWQSLSLYQAKANDLLSTKNIALEKVYIYLCLGFIFFQSKINQSLKFKSNSGSFSILLQNFWSLVDGGIPTDRVKSNVNIVYAFPRKIENMKHPRIENKFCQTTHNQIVNVYCSHLSFSLCQQLNA